jgi:hypothetical protein
MSNSLPFLLASNYGVKADGVSDDTAALQSAINAAVNQTLVLPAGAMVVSSTLNFGSTVDTTYVVVGQGGGETALTQFLWKGNAASPLFSLNGVRDSKFSDFTVRASSNPLQTAFLSQTIAGTTATNNFFERIWLQGTTTGLVKGWQFVAGTGGDNNNDENVFIDCTVSNFTVAAWSFEHAQSQAHRFFGCNFIGSAGQTNQYGVTTALGSGNRGGYFNWYAGSSGGVGEADFYLGSPNGPVLISGGVYENSPRFLEMNGSSANAWTVTVEGCRITGNHLNADGKIMIVTNRGPLVLIGNHIGEQLGGATTALQIFADTTGGTNSAPAIAMGNNVWSTLAVPFTGRYRWTTIGNNLSPGLGATPQLYPNQL